MKLKKTLHRSGYWVFTARRWIKALKILKYERIKLVVIKHYLENISGLEAVEQIKNEINSDIKIIYIAPELANRKRGIEAGADDYLTNPSDTRLLLKKIRLLLEPLEVSDEYLRFKGYW